MNLKATLPIRLMNVTSLYIIVSGPQPSGLRCWNLLCNTTPLRKPCPECFLYSLLFPTKLSMQKILLILCSTSIPAVTAVNWLLCLVMHYNYTHLWRGLYLHSHLLPLCGPNLAMSAGFCTHVPTNCASSSNLSVTCLWMTELDWFNGTFSSSSAKTTHTYKKEANKCIHAHAAILF